MTTTVTPDDIPVSVTKLVYTAPYSVLATAVGSMSQNQCAELLAHFWPEIEQHIREQVADEIDAAADRTVAEYPDNPAMSARVIGQRAAARIARDTTRSTR